MWSVNCRTIIVERINASWIPASNSMSINFWGFSFFFCCGGEKVNTVPMLCRWPYFVGNLGAVCALAFLLNSFCVILVCVVKWIFFLFRNKFQYALWNFSCKSVVSGHVSKWGCANSDWFCSSPGSWVLTACNAVLLLFSTVCFFSLPVRNKYQYD